MIAMMSLGQQHHIPFNVLNFVETVFAFIMFIENKIIFQYKHRPPIICNCEFQCLDVTFATPNVTAHRFQNSINSINLTLINVFYFLNFIQY